MERKRHLAIDHGPMVTGMYPGKSHGQGPWVNHERHRLDDISSANRRIRSCSILLLEDGDYRRAKASAHKARVTNCVLDPSNGGQATHGARFTQLQAPGGKTLHAACLILY